MTIRNLEFLFKPRSIVVIGASERPMSVGSAVTRNVLAGGFAGPIALINPLRESIAGHDCFHSVEDLDVVPDLAVICTPPASVPELIGKLGERGTRAAIVLSAGLDATNDAGISFKQAMLDAAKPHLLRVLGPNCVGLLSPAIGLNASFAHAPAHKGKLAFVSQSGALTTALLDWARSRQIGFSHFVSLGEAADIDFGDVLDYLAGDPDTRAILLYIESIKAARKFMSAARAAGRSKRIIAIKSGRAPEGAKAVASHTGSLAGTDEVYDAALRRAGALRVDSLLDLFLAAETLARARPINGERVAIITNGGGLAVLAADALSLHGGTLATLSQATVERLNAILPATWSHANPVDIIGDAPAARYVAALGPVFEDPNVDAVLFLHAPTAIVDSATIAQACVPVLRDARKPSFCCWLGGDAVAAARQASVAAGLPTYDTPEAAVTAFLQVADHRRNQQLLMETPPSLARAQAQNSQLAQRIVDDHIAAKTEMLNETASKQILSAYGIDIVETHTARDEAEAVRIAESMGFPVVLKILSPDISHKSDVGGVALDLRSRETVGSAAKLMLERVRAAHPDARIEGFAVERMIVTRKSAVELIVGVATDPVFGPTILFGAGGTAVETVRDKAMALPPLNVVLARDLISRTRISRLLAGYRDVPAVDMPALDRVLLGVAQLIADVPDIVELDINPLLASADGAIALDARIRVVRNAQRGTERFAIRPYPVQLEGWVDIMGERCLVRPIRPEDESKYPVLFEKTTEEDIYFRLFQKVSGLSHQDLARFTQIDYDREMALVALDTDGEILGIVRSIADPDNVRAEFAILVRSDWSGHGLGYALLSRIVAYCGERGTQEIFGDVLTNNRRMLELVRTLGFTTVSLGYNVTRVTLLLKRAAGLAKNLAAD